MINTPIHRILELMQEPSWQDLAVAWPHSQAMQTCMQDPVFHAEGDVWTHTRMVYDSLDSPTDILAATALYHDVAKPQTRSEIENQDRIRISHPHHSRLGAGIWLKDAHEHNWLSFEERRSVYWLIQHHQRVFHLWSKQNMLWEAERIHADVNIHALIDFALADNQGRVCDYNHNTREDLLLLKEWCDENLINWQNTEHRFSWINNSHRDPNFVPPHPQGSRAMIMCGMPGSGKDTHIRTHLPHLPMVSMDQIRQDLKIDPIDNQGRASQAAQEQARVHLRKKQDFIWNATSLTRLTREKIIQLCRDYDAHVTICVLGTPWQECVARNNKRKDPVPMNVMLGMLDKWEVPSYSEAHKIEWI